MKQTWSKLRERVVHVYIEYVCFMFASSCKWGIRSWGQHMLHNSYSVHHYKIYCSNWKRN